MPLLELLVVVFALLAIATPFITLVLLGKYNKLRENLDQLAEENSRQHTSFQREVADLKRQLTSAVHAAAPVTGEPAQRPAVPAAPPVKETSVPVISVEIPTSVKLPVPMSFPPSEKQPEPQQPMEKPQVPGPVAPPPMPSVPTAPPAQKLPVPSTSVGQKPVLPAAAKTPAELKPSAPIIPPQTTPPAAARVSAPPPIFAYRAPAPKPTFQQRMKTVSAIEEALGTNWLNKLGIIILVVGVALFGIYELGALGPLGKVGISYLAAAFLLVGGI